MRGHRRAIKALAREARATLSTWSPQRNSPRQGVLGLQGLGTLMSLLVNATFINGYNGRTFPMLGKVAPAYSGVADQF